MIAVPHADSVAWATLSCPISRPKTSCGATPRKHPRAFEWYAQSGNTLGFATVGLRGLWLSITLRRKCGPMVLARSEGEEAS